MFIWKVLDSFLFAAHLPKTPKRSTRSWPLRSSRGITRRPLPAWRWSPTFQRSKRKGPSALDPDLGEGPLVGPVAPVAAQLSGAGGSGGTPVLSG